MTDCPCPNPFFGPLTTVVATFIGAGLAYLSAMRQQRKRDARLRKAHAVALLAEVERCIALANIYLSEDFRSPAYRFPSGIYEGSFPQLISDGQLSHGDVQAVLDFYSQVQQVNWLLDEIHRHRLDKNDAMLAKEVSRLTAKLKEMNQAGTRFFDPVMRALSRYGSESVLASMHRTGLWAQWRNRKSS